MTGCSQLWAGVDGYVDTASYGLPSVETYRAVDEAMQSWRAGAGVWEDWTKATESARESFSRMLSVSARSVTIGSTSSQLIGQVATSLRRDSVVVVPDIEFTSNLFPWLVAENRGIKVHAVPLEYLPDRIAQGCDLVATSAVQSATGEVVDLSAISIAARSVDAVTVIDATQAAGWLPIDASDFDAVVCSGYKWLCSPRGVAYMTLSERLAATMEPSSAGWYAGEKVQESYYGPPLRLAKDARRFDISPAWFSWIGAAAANEDMLSIGIDRIFRHNVDLANRLQAELDLPATDSAIISLRVSSTVDPKHVPFRASFRGGGLRLSFHHYNDDDDLDTVASFLKDKVAR